MGEFRLRCLREGAAARLPAPRPLRETKKTVVEVDLFSLFPPVRFTAKMTQSSSIPLPKVDLQPGKPPMLRVSAAGDAARWTAEHRNVLRALVAEHGALLVRGLGLRDQGETERVFRQLGSLMIETEAFALPA